MPHATEVKLSKRD